MAEGWALLGGAMSLAGSGDRAVEALKRAIAIHPDESRFHYDLGVILSQVGEFHYAESSYRRAVELRGGFPEALNNLGNLLRRRKASSDAVACYQRALRFRPQYTDAIYNMGLALQDLDRLEEAEDCYRDVLKEKPEHHFALNNLANVELGLGRVDAALSRYEKALRVAPDNREYRVNLGMAQLLAANLSEGWRNYAARSAPAILGVPVWNGEAVKGRRILLLSEQGLGDTIQFIRYARQLRYDGGRVSALCPEPLAELLRTTPGMETVFVNGQQPPASDWCAPLLHLPAMFRTRVESIPAEMPYLFADAERTRQWESALDLPASHLKVGVAWRGGADHWNDRNRSLNPGDLAMLNGIPDTAWVSLQKGYPQGHDSLPFVPLHRDLGDFADTAALIDHLDLVISVDTSIAHLAGALARPVWTLLPYAPDWRWLRDRSDSPWYPTMRLFRQQHRGEWKPVLEQVREELWRRHSSRYGASAA